VGINTLERIDYSKRFANGKVYINDIEGFWSYANERLMKYHGVSGDLDHFFSGTTSVSYSISKAALNMVIASMTNELRRYNIIVISMHHGWVRADMGGSAAPVLLCESARRIIDVTMSLTTKDSGNFFDYKR